MQEYCTLSATKLDSDITATRDFMQQCLKYSKRDEFISLFQTASAEMAECGDAEICELLIMNSPLSSLVYTSL